MADTRTGKSISDAVERKTGRLLFAPRLVERNLLHVTDEAQAGNPGDRAILDDPLFADERAGDFRLQGDSPASGAGIRLIRSGGTTDIGASGIATEAWKDLSF